MEEARDEERLRLEREKIAKVNEMDPYNKRREDAINKSKSETVKGVDIRTPKSAYRFKDGYYEIRDEFSKDPKRRKNIVDAAWLDDGGE